MCVSLALSSPCPLAGRVREKAGAPCWETLTIGVQLPSGGSSGLRRYPCTPKLPRRLQLSLAYLARAGAEDGSVHLSSSVLHHSLALHLQRRRFFRSGYCYLLVLAPRSSKGSPTVSGFVQSETRGHSTNNLRSRRGGEGEQGTDALEKRLGQGCGFGEAHPCAGATVRPLPSCARAHGRPDKTVASW